MYLSVFLRRKTALVALFLGLSMLYSCSSSMDEVSVNQKSRVRIDVRTFQFDIEDEPMRTARSISDAATRLSFAVFDSEGALVGSAIHQNSSADDFGTVELELYPGNYRMVAVAHNADEDAAITSTTSVTLPGTTFTDTFSKVQDLTVEPDEDCSFTMQLPRATSAFILRITDTPPTNLKEIKVIVNNLGYEPTSLKINPDTQLAENTWKQTRIIPVANLSNEEPIYFIKLYKATTVNIVATAYATDGSEIISHTINNVSLTPNQKTIATGHFFNPKVSGTFTLETTWSTDNEIEY